MKIPPTDKFVPIRWKYQGHIRQQHSPKNLENWRKKEDLFFPLVSVSTVLPLDCEDVATCSEITREKRMSKQKSSISCNLRISSHISIFISSQIYIPRLLPCNVSHTTRNQKCKQAAAAALDSCFSKIFNFFCVPLTLPVWLLNAWVCACLDMARNHQGNRT